VVLIFKCGIVKVAKYNDASIVSNSVLCHSTLLSFCP
jgi:hypothetical protein